jgi:hypothetical protein
MDFLDNLQNAIYRDDEIVHFDAGENGYYAYTRPGARIDITHVFNFQPPIGDFGGFHSFMFVESLQGFFIFRQRIFENKEEPWRIYLELTPREPLCFFKDAVAFHARLRRLWSGGEEFLK